MLFTRLRQASCLLYASFLCIPVLTISAQSPAIHYELHFVEKTETYFFRTDLDWEPNQVELLRMMPYSSRDSVIKQVTLDNDIRTTIWHKDNSRLEEWMSHPARTVIDNTRTRTYDSDNNILMNTPHSDVYLESYQTLRDTLNVLEGSIIPEFPMLTKKMKQDFIYNGFTMENLGGGAVSFIKDSISYTINNKKKIWEARVYDEIGAVVHYEKKGFVKNELNQLVPAYEIVRSMDDRFSEGSVYRVEITTYPEYSINYVSPLRQSSLAFEPVWSLYPNPVSDRLVIEWFDLGGSIATWQIINMAGVEVASGEFQGEEQVELDLSQYPSGCYLVILRSGNRIERDQFIKL